MIIKVDFKNKVVLSTEGKEGVPTFRREVRKVGKKSLEEALKYMFCDFDSLFPQNKNMLSKKDCTATVTLSREAYLAATKGE